MNIGITCSSLKHPAAAMFVALVLKRWPGSIITVLHVKRSLMRVIEEALDKHGLAGCFRYAFARLMGDACGDDERAFLMKGLRKLAEANHLERWQEAMRVRDKRVRCCSVRGVNLKETVEIVKEESLDILVNFGGEIFKRQIVDAVGVGVLNSHLGALPEYRGMNTIEWSLFLGGKPALTIHMIDESIDTGDMLLSREIEVKENDTIASLRGRSIADGVAALIDVVDLMEKGELKREDQNTSFGRQYYAMHPVLRDVVQRKLLRAGK